MQQNYSLDTVHEILLIDNNYSTAQRLIGLLDENGQQLRFRLTHRPDLSQGLLALLDNRATVAVIVSCLNEKSACAMLQRLRKRFPTITVILLTDQKKTTEEPACQQLDVQDVLEKEQLTADTLLRSLRFAVERYRLIQQMNEVRHELRTPISAISGLAHLLLQSDLQEEQQRYVRSMQQSAELLLELSQSLTASSKKAVASAKQVFSLRETVESVMDIMRTNIGEQPVELRYIIGEEVPEFLEGNSVHLKQILINLLGNAIKFTGEGEVKLVVHDSPSEDNQMWLEFMITDTGIGIPQGLQEMIFQTYQRVDDDAPGHGLGLSIVRTLVEQQGGTVRVRSRLGIGSTFTVRLPVKPATKPTEQAAPIFTPVTGNLIDLLLVEDNAVNQLVTRRILEKQIPNIRVTTASSGTEALHILHQQAFQVMLLDLQLPGLDGYETITRLRRESKPELAQLPVLAMTAHSDLGEEDFRHWGFTDYILKPFEPHELVKKIVRYAKPARMNSKVYTYIDLSYLDIMADGDVALRRLMLEMLLKEIHTEFGQYRPLYEQQHWKELHRISHKMKTTLTFVGDTKLTKLNEQVERLVKTKTDLTKLPSLIQHIEERYPDVLEEIKLELESF